MFSMFALWAIVFVGVALHQRWVTPLAIVAFVWTLVLLKLHISDPIPLNF